VYLDGTVANVQIIERVDTPPKEDVTAPANLVAACDGQIELIELYRGNCVVSIGQAVRKGELLVSGLYDSNQTGYRYTRAAGSILARTEHSFTVEIPFAYEQKVYETAKCGEIALNFFNFSVKIFKRTGNQVSTCDIIENEEDWGLPGLRNLPVGLTVTQWKPYTVQSARRSEEEALAYDALERELSQLSENAQLLRKSVSTTITETSLILVCTVSCLEDIAVQSEFAVTEEPE
jgi:similar to stage IV sporulation protein